MFLSLVYSDELGHFTVLRYYSSLFCQADLSVWRSHEHNMGMAFDRATWNRIKECSEVRRQGLMVSKTATFHTVVVICTCQKARAILLKLLLILHSEIHPVSMLDETADIIIFVLFSCGESQ